MLGELEGIRIKKIKIKYKTMIFKNYLEGGNKTLKSVFKFKYFRMCSQIQFHLVKHC